MNTSSQYANVKKVVTKLVLSCDLGGSLVKAIAQIYPDGIPYVLAMEPEVADTSKSAIQRLTPNSLAYNTGTWIGIQEEYYVFGILAKNLFAGTAALRHLKTEYAMPKIAALLWLACCRLKIKDQVEVLIQVLLPPGEVNTAKQMAPLFAQKLRRGIVTPTGKLKANVLNFHVCAEGTGIITYRSRTLGKTYFHKSLGMLMLGYRNASFVATAKGNPVMAESTPLGMNWLVQQFVERTAVGLSKEDSRLVPAILAAGKGNFDGLRCLSINSTSQGIQSDLNLFQKALPEVRFDYCRALIRWIKNIASLDEMIICGGTANFVRNELSEHFETENIPIVWNGGVEFPKPLDTLTLGNRVADVWTAHITYIKMLDKNFAYSRKQDLVPDPSRPAPRYFAQSDEELTQFGHLTLRPGR